MSGLSHTATREALLQTQAAVEAILGKTPLSIRGTLPNDFDITLFQQSKLRHIQYSIDVDAIVAKVGDAASVQAVVAEMEPGSILVVRQCSAAIIDALLVEIHRQLYEVVPIYLMLHYPEDGKGKKTFNKKSGVEGNNKAARRRLPNRD